jgi:transcription elongation factor Elf1
MITVDNTNILPCPFCGNDHIAHIIVPQYDKPGFPPDSWIVCNSCGVEVRANNTTSALDLWNKRP